MFMLFRLFYTSRCTVRDSYQAENTFKQIILKSSVNNARNNITGAMTFDGNDFAQILEGEKPQVLALFEIIKQDQRHENVRIIGELDCKKRYFSNWAMKNIDSSNYDELVKAMLPGTYRS